MATTTVAVTEQQPSLTHVDPVVPAPAPEITTIEPPQTKASQPSPKDQKALIPLHELDRSKEFIECPYCHAQAVSHVTNDPSDATKYANLPLPSSAPFN